MHSGVADAEFDYAELCRVLVTLSTKELPEGLLPGGTLLADDLALDSLALVELACVLEEWTGKEVIGSLSELSVQELAEELGVC